ncbi:hypothetical protein ACJGFH_001616 [Escherichia coli]|uniref:hypothetical protein n=1 Tax=Escherichia coli TaxID=562 RepID=UPI00176B09E1|nr:hypothetical protein [Escherichia coli]MBE9725654.1 hypothetical protein [Escherichia coli]MBE9752987.1 hypothetical protein [Escherichia coli]MBE9839104.1 hypothetical protein [Escherichia coli]MBE9961156.1 hypothetical protein [Escherichia coli]MBF0001008.1 hypothetical protein [Escherichia coli]
MKQMSLIEMDGFLKGKCFPRDLKVNETNAEYLVRKFAEAEAKCAALAAEVEAVKPAHQDAVNTIMYTANRTGVLYTEKAIQMSCKTPATDAFLAEVRAQGVEMLYASRAAQWADELLAELNEFATQLREGGAA